MCKDGPCASQASEAFPASLGQWRFYFFTFLFSFLPFWRINIHHMPCQNHHRRASFSCFCGGGKQRVQLLQCRQTALPPAPWRTITTKKAPVKKTGTQEPSQPLQWAFPYEALLNGTYILYLIWHPLFGYYFTLAPSYDWQTGLIGELSVWTPGIFSAPLCIACL